MKNLKQFFWKYGGAADQLDAFMVSDDDVDKVIYELANCIDFILSFFFEGLGN